MAKRINTIFIENSHIRLMVARGNQVEQWASTPLDPGMVSNGVIRDKDAVADKLRELIATAKPRKGKMIAGLSGLDSLYRIITLPKMQDSLLAEAVEREAASVIPIPLDELYLSWQKIYSSKEENLIFLSVFPKASADVLIDTLRSAGIMPSVLDLAPLALCRVANEQKCIIVDAKLDHLDIIIMVDRIPQVIRSMSLQSDANTLSENLPVINEEISRTIAFYNSSHQEEPLDSNVPLLISGKMAAFPEILKSLVSELNCPVSALRSTMVYPANFPLTDFMVNIGLASKTLALEKSTGNFSLINFNAMPVKYLPARIHPLKIIVPAVVVLGIAAVVLLWLNLRNVTDSNTALTTQIQTTNNSVNQNAIDITNLKKQKQPIQDQLDSISALGDTLKEKLAVLGSAQSHVYNDCYLIENLKQEAITLLDIQISETLGGESQLSVSGSALNESDIFEYAAVLRDSGGFTVNISSIQYGSEFTGDGGKNEWYNFHLQLG